MNPAPLRFPPQWAELRRRSFLVGFPIIGPQAGAYRNICAQLAERTREDWAAWGPDETRVKAAQYVAQTTEEAVGWPNPVFIPEDPCELVFWDHKSCVIDDLSLVEAFADIETHFNVSLSEQEMESIHAGTVGGCVDYLLGRTKR